MGLPSCSQTDDMEIPTETKSEIRVNFTISFSEAASRALDESNKGAEPGTAQENSINQYDFRMPVYYTNDGTYFSEIIVQSIKPNQTGTEYTVAGVLKTNDISQVSSKGGIRVAVLANCGIPFNATFESTTLATLPKAYTYKFDSSFTIGEDRIPMVGISDPLTALSETATNDLGQIDLLRAMSKIEVKLNDTFTGYELTKVVLHNYNSNGYCSPSSLTDISANDGENNNPADTWLGLGLHIPNTPGTVIGNIVKEGGNYIFYVPEYDNPEALNIEATDNKSYLTVTLKKTGESETKDYDIYFSVYSSGEPTAEALDLKRNHYYLYTITGVSTGNEPTLTVSVENWDLNEENLSFQDYVSVGTDGQIAWFEGGNTSGTSITPSKSTSGDKAYIYSNAKDGYVTCRFNISTPVGGTWYASLIGSGENASAFEFSAASQLGTDSKEYASYTNTMAKGSVGMGPITLTIKTVSDRPKLVNNEAILQIYVETYDKRTIAVKELLNSEDYSGIDMCTLIQTID